MTRKTSRAILIAATTLLGALPATAAERYHGFQGEGPGYIPFLDSREQRLQPLADQLAAVEALSAVVRWNRHGTPKTLFKRGAFLSGPSAAAPDQVARSFLLQHADLFGLTTAMINAMEVLRVSPLHESPDYARMLRGEAVDSDNVPHVVLLRQMWDGVPAGGRDGLVSVGVARDGRVAFVGSTLSRETQLGGSVVLSMVDALLAGASDVDMNLGVLELLPSKASTLIDSFNTFTSSLLEDVQRVRLRALPIPGQGVRRVFEVTLLDSSHERGHPQAFIIHLDAETGRIWLRDNAVQHLHDPAEPEAYPAKASYGQISGATSEGGCGELHSLSVDEGNALMQITVTAVDLADITMNLYYDGQIVASQDLLTSPEVLLYQPAGGIVAGDYQLEVCPYEAADAPASSYVGFYSATPGAPVALPGSSSPAWKVFPNSPVPARFGPPDAVVGDDTRETWCWDVATGDLDDSDVARDPASCDRLELSNVSSRLPWDAHAPLGVPTFTTQGNNALTAVSNVNFVAPDTVVLRPIALDRTYDFEFTNAWYDSACSPLAFLDPTLNFNDFEAATVNLFAMHNRMHDWSYLLGWTEVNSNLQLDNFGLTGVLRQNDPEIGSSQAGRVTINGRDNANQLTLQDGIPGITNQYLWQALPASIYPAGCVDGAYDMVIIAHEYTHATSNRMTGGPDASLGGGHASAMGEAWSDLAGIEYVQGYGMAPVGEESPYAAAIYSTGDPQAGIRNYGIDQSPLKFSDFDYDGNGAGSPHANSEIWGAAMYQVRQRLIDKYAAQYPFEDLERQIDCADGKYNSTSCPGNRRWIQLMYDGLLLQPASPTMLDARDAIIAADLLRYDGANQFELWDAFAYSGMGEQAVAASVDDFDTVPDFASPLRNDNAQITFKVVGSDGSTPLASIYTGHYEARVTTTADTNPDSELGDSMSYVPGDYTFLVQAPGYGHHRFQRSFQAGQSGTVTFTIRPNLAALARGAVATGDGDSDEDLLALIDETEATNWSSSDGTGTASEGKGEGAFVEGRQVTVQLSERSVLRDVNVSALLNAQNRYTALRSFDLLTCDASVADCSSEAGFTPWYASADDAFNGRFLRPKSPHLLLRAFDVPEATATHVRLVVRDSQCTGGPDFQREANPSGDPTNDPDCDTGFNLQLTALGLTELALPTDNAQIVRIAELQVFGEKLAADSGELRNPDQAGVSAPVDAEEPLPDSTPPASTPLDQRGGSLGVLMLLLGLPLILRRRRR